MRAAVLRWEAVSTYGKTSAPCDGADLRQGHPIRVPGQVTRLGPLGGDPKALMAPSRGSGWIAVRV